MCEPVINILKQLLIAMFSRYLFAKMLLFEFLNTETAEIFENVIYVFILCKSTY